MSEEGRRGPVKEQRAKVAGEGLAAGSLVLTGPVHHCGSRSAKGQQTWRTVAARQSTARAPEPLL